MTVNGRDEEDVDPDTILKKVAKASGANFNFHQQNQAYRDTPSGPVVSRYLKPQRHFHCFRHLSTLGLTHDQPGKKKETRFIDQTDLYCAFFVVPALTSSELAAESALSQENVRVVNPGACASY